MKEAKKVPASSGVLVPHSQSPPPATYVPPVVSTTPRPVTTTVSYSSPSYYYPKAPNVFIRPHSQPEDKYLPPSNDLDQPAVAIPSNDILSPDLIFLPPHEDTSNLPPLAVIPSSTPVPRIDESHLPPLAYYPPSEQSSTVAPPRDDSHLPPIAYYPSSTANPLESNSVIPLSSTPAPFSGKHLSSGFVPISEYGVVPIQPKTRFAYRPTYQYASSTERPIIDYSRNTIDASSYRNRAVPLFDRSKYEQQPQYPSYDGVGVTANGFRYYLPRQYQEEVSNNDGSRDGSFGYVDPFGIRRVVYYNAGRNGFIHRKNNRYVGFNSTPYDPRPN
jgi:hypothetical protein